MSCARCSGAVEVLKLSLESGKVNSQTSYKAPWSIALAPSVVLRDSVVAALSSDGQQLCTSSLQGE